MTEREGGTSVYLHTVQYYETDMMQIVHHSNYIRWMEEARLAHLEKVGLAYDKMEADGILAPVLSASCQYKMSTKYGETVKIYVKMEHFTGLKFSLSYRIVSMDETVLHATGETSHCFVDRQMRPVNVKRVAPAIYAYFQEYR